MVEFVNLTPHEVIVFDEEGKNVLLRVPPSGQIARVEVRRELVGDVNGIPAVRNEFGEVTGLPEPCEDTIYIVSLIVLNALGGKRKDVVAPDTSPAGAVRDEEGRIIGVRAFVVP